MSGEIRADHPTRLLTVDEFDLAGQDFLEAAVYIVVPGFGDRCPVARVSCPRGSATRDVINIDHPVPFSA